MNECTEVQRDSHTLRWWPGWHGRRVGCGGRKTRSHQFLEASGHQAKDTGVVMNNRINTVVLEKQGREILK